MKKYCIALLGVLFLVACKNNSFDILKFHWLVGKWQGQKDSIHFFKEWSMEKNYNLSGKGGACQFTDTLFAEKIKIEMRND